MSIQKCLLDNSSRMIKAMSANKSSSSEAPKTGVQSGLKRIAGLAMLSLTIQDVTKKVGTNLPAAQFE